MTAIEFLEKKYPGLNIEDKSGFINGNFWKGVALEMEDYHQAKLKELSQSKGN